MRAIAVLGLLAVACGDPGRAPPITFPDPIPTIVGAVRLCDSDEQCDPGTVCSGGVCDAPTSKSDAGIADATVSDRGFTDSGLATDATPFEADAAEVERDAGVPDAVADAGIGPSYDLGGCVLVNNEVAASQRYVIPSGTILRPGDVLILVRDATRAELEGMFGPLASSVQVLSTGATSVGAPIINGNESFMLEGPDGRVLDDSATVGRAGFDYQRDASGTFTEGPEESASPGVAPALSASPTPRITEWSDRSGTGQFRFELVEISYQP